MSDISQAVLQQVGLKTSPFSPTSRYNGIEITAMQTADERTIPYLRRRFIPKADNFYVLQVHMVTEDERLDNIAARYLGDPERYWQICDANNAMNPDALTEEPGAIIMITLPAGIPGVSNA